MSVPAVAVTGPTFVSSISAVGVTGVVTGAGNSGSDPANPSGSISAVLTMAAVVEASTRTMKRTSAASPGFTMPGPAPGLFTSIPRTSGDVPS